MELTVDKAGIVRLNANILELKAYASISIDAPEVLIKDRLVLDQKDAI
jgi:hypothetical protein